MAGPIRSRSRRSPWILFPLVLVGVLSACSDVPAPTPGPTPSPSDSAPEATDSGANILYEYRRGAGKVQWLANSRGRDARVITDRVEPGVEYVHSDWAPDGSSMAFEALATSGPSSIWLADAEGDGAKEKVACVTDQVSNLYTIRPDGTGLHQLTTLTKTDGVRVGEPTWTPDGRSVIAALGIVRPDGGLSDAELTYVDPESGALDRLHVVGASPRLQPT